MRYKFTKLTDSFSGKKGIVRRSYGVQKDSELGPCYKVQTPPDPKTHWQQWTLEPVGGELDNHLLYRKEIDYDSLTDMRCPVCGSTQFDTKFYPWRDKQGHFCLKLVFECTCGHLKTFTYTSQE